MHPVNLINTSKSELNAFRIFSSGNDNSQRKLALMEKLQSSLDLAEILNIFACEVAKFTHFSGLYFNQSSIQTSSRGSRRGKSERHFELKVGHVYIGTLTYAINSPISLLNYKILCDLHQCLVHPLTNAIKYQQALSFAMQDSLTSLGNRRYYDEQLKRAIHHANRHQTNVGLIVCDLNKFKVINDTYGHHIGDEILIQFADVLKISTRDSDSIFRFGGDEFTIIVEDAGSTSLTMIEHRINRAIKHNPLLSKYNVGCSIGGTFLSRDDTELTIFERADEALYRQKNSNQQKLSVVS